MALLAAQRFIDQPLVIVVIFLGAITVFIYLAYRLNKFVESRRVRAERKRGDEIAAAMSGHGLTLTYYKSGQHAALFQPFAIGQRGEAGSRLVWNLLESPGGTAQTIRMADYSFVFFNGQRRVVFGQTVVLIERPDLALPHFCLAKEAQFQWAKELFKTQDIDFADDPKFSTMYRLQGKDEAAIHALFTPQVRSGIESYPGLTIEGSGTQLLIFREGNVLDPKEWPGFLDEARQVAQFFIRTA